MGLPYDIWGQLYNLIQRYIVVQDFEGLTLGFTGTEFNQTMFFN
jgi:hypothetical protein